MLLLCLDTATPAVAAAVVELGPTGPGRVLAESGQVDARRHGELLAPAVVAVLAGAGIGPDRLGGVAVGLGPGPYTSLRVGVVTAAAMAEALGVPAYGACSLDLLAAGAGGDCVVLTDARRREVYWARYAGGVRVAGPAVAVPAAVPLAAHDRLVGEGARMYADVLGGPASPPWHAPAALLADVVADRVRAGARCEVLAPLYLRRPDAAEPIAPVAGTRP